MKQLKRYALDSRTGAMCEDLNGKLCFTSDVEAIIPKPCLWKPTRTFDIETTCGANPSSNGLGFAYCPYCGGKLMRPKDES